VRAARGRRAFGWALVVVALVAAGALGQATRRAPVLKIVGAEPRAVVRVDHVGHGRVDESGSRTIATLSPGKHTVTVRQLGYVDSVHVVVLSTNATATVKPKKVVLGDEAELARQRGDDLMLDGKRQEAIVEYRAAIDARNGRFVEARIGLARAHLGLKQFEEANQAIGVALEAEPRNVAAHTVAATILRESGLAEEAIAEYRKAIAIAPSQTPEAHTGLAVVLDGRGETAEAVAEYRKGIAQNQDVEPILYQLLGSALERLGQRKEATAAYERFLALAPDHALAPAVRSIMEQLSQEQTTPGETEDVNPYAPRP
jgi:Tfp pilus assembly protein PilF